MSKLKKLAFGVSTLGAVVIGASFFAAFEAHIINVTAKIENALNVPVKFLEYGTVFPQEYLIKDVDVQLSQSFLDEDRVDDVEYFIRQKPKCAITWDNGRSYDNTVGPDGSHIYTRTGHIKFGDNPATEQTETDFSYIDCGRAPRELTQSETWGVLPSLCPYLSKHKEDDGQFTGNPAKETQINAFHTPYTINGTTITWNDAKGYLTKAGDDEKDTWKIDLAVPCFGNYCAQDWASFVDGKNPGEGVNADSWTQPIENEHKIFGCDLWVEVSGVSLATTSTEPAKLIVNKVVVNDNGGNNVVGDFTLKVDGGNVVSGAENIFSAGAHIVTESGVPGYQATFSGDCDANGNVTLVAGQTKTCTLTNNDIQPTITLVKNVVGGSATATDFVLRLNGSQVQNNTSVPVSANVANAISEDLNVLGYTFTSITGSPECPAVLGGTATLDEGESITCTITNTFQ